MDLARIGHFRGADRAALSTGVTESDVRVVLCLVGEEPPAVIRNLAGLVHLNEGGQEEGASSGQIAPASAGKGQMDVFSLAPATYWSDSEWYARIMQQIDEYARTH